MTTIENRPGVYTEIRLNGYEPLNKLWKEWQSQGNTPMPAVDWKRMFDNNVFGNLSIRVHRYDTILPDGTLKPRYDRFVKVSACVDHLKRLLTL